MSLIGFSFKLHSMVDVITNSSTTIFTFSETSIGPAKELINSFCKLMNYDKTADEMFYIDSFVDYYAMAENLEQYVEDDLDSDDVITEIGDRTITKANFGDFDVKDIIESVQEDVLKKGIPKPHWMLGDKDYDDMQGTTICIEPKSQEFKEVAQLLKKFLYSTDHEASYNG